MSTEYKAFQAVGFDGVRQTYRTRSNGSAVGDEMLDSFARAVARTNRRDAEVNRICRDAGARYLAPLDGWTKWPTKDADCARAREKRRPVKMPPACEQVLAYSRPGTEQAGELVAIVQTWAFEGVWMTLYRIARVEPLWLASEMPPTLHLERVQPTLRLQVMGA